METIKGIPEAVEAPADFAGSIVARDESLALYASAPGLGPPDLCWLQKAAKGSFLGGASEPRGFFHYVLGRDVSNSAAIAAYFAELNAKVEPVGLMQGLWTSSETKVDRGFYCCYDPFNRLDVRCELCIPGGVVCGALDADGSVHDVTDTIWRNCVVAAFLRHQLYDPELTAHSSMLHRWAVLPNTDAEARLLKAVYDMYASKLLPNALDFITPDTGHGCTAEHMDVVLHAVFHYFGARHHWKAALDFFTRLKQIYLPAAVYVAAVQRELDSFDASFKTLSEAVELSPSEPSLLLALGNECLYAEQTDMAAKLARRAVRLRRTLRPAWLLLARCYIRQGLYSLALITLNVVPPPPMPSSEQEMLLGVIHPEPKYVTKPASERYEPDVQAARHMSHEEVVSDGLRALLYLPAAVMVPREPLDLGPWPDLGPGRLTRAVLAAAYGLLQELVAAIGWDSFLEMRARVFVMQSEGQQHGGKKQQALSPTGAGAASPARGKASAFNDALEELAAIGLSEYPEDVSEARTANLLASQTSEAETTMETSGNMGDRMATPKASKPEIGAMGGQVANIVAKQASVSPPSPQEEHPPTLQLEIETSDSTAAAAAHSDGAEAVSTQAAQAADVAIQQKDQGMHPPGEDVDQQEQHGSHAPALEDAHAHDDDEQEQPAWGLGGMLSSIPGTAALWGMMFGGTKQPSHQHQLAHEQLLKLQQVGSVPLSAMPSRALSEAKSAALSAAPSRSIPDHTASHTTSPTKHSAGGLHVSTSGPRPVAEGAEDVPQAEGPGLQGQPCIEAAVESPSSWHFAACRQQNAKVGWVDNPWQQQAGTSQGAVRHRCHRASSKIGQQHGQSMAGSHNSQHKLLRRLKHALKRITGVPGKILHGLNSSSAVAAQQHKQLTVQSLLALLRQQQQQAAASAASTLAHGSCRKQQLQHISQVKLGELLKHLTVVGHKGGSLQVCMPTQLQSARHLHGSIKAQAGPMCEATETTSSQLESSLGSGTDGGSGEHSQQQAGSGLVSRESSRPARAGPRAAKMMQAMLAPHQTPPQSNINTGVPGKAGPPISILDADRDFVLLGAAAMEQVESLQGAKAKRLCVRWLDELTIALWHDLQAYMECKTLDAELLELVGNTASGLVLGLPARTTAASQDSSGSEETSGLGGPVPSNALAAAVATSNTSPHAASHAELAPKPSGGGNGLVSRLSAGLAAKLSSATGLTPRPSKASSTAQTQQEQDEEKEKLVDASLALLASVQALTAGDWMRRGLLAERLYHDAEALAAYQCCLVVATSHVSSGGASSGVLTSQPHLLAAHAVMRLAAEAGDAKLAVQACLLTLIWHASKLHAISASGTAPQGNMAALQTCAFPPTPVICCLGQLNATLGETKLLALIDDVCTAGLSGFGGGKAASSQARASAHAVPAVVKAWAEQLAKKVT